MLFQTLASKPYSIIFLFQMFKIEFLEENSNKRFDKATITLSN